MNTDPNRSSDDVAPADDVAPEAAHAASPPPSNSSTRALIGILLAGTAGMIIFLFVHLSNDGGIRPGPAPAQAECGKGQRDCLPDLNYVDTFGTAYSHDSLAGKVVLVNFWATWCHPCEVEIPALSKAYEKYKSQGVVFLGVMMDDNAPNSQQLLNFQSDHDMTYPVVRKTDELVASYHYPDAFPTTFVFDRSGKQVYSHLGPLRERDLDSLLGQLVAQK